MLYGRLLCRPAAAEVRQMLHRIKMENVERGRRVTTAYMEATSNTNEKLEQEDSGSQPGWKRVIRPLTSTAFPDFE